MAPEGGADKASLGTISQDDAVVAGQAYKELLQRRMRVRPDH